MESEVQRVQLEQFTFSRERMQDSQLSNTDILSTSTSARKFLKNYFFNFIINIDINSPPNVTSSIGFICN